MMASVWNGETGTAIPSSNASVSITTDCDHVRDKRLWPMLSQKRGFHYGDDVTLEGGRTYQVDLEFGPGSTRTTGDFQDAFDERASDALLQPRLQPVDAGGRAVPTSGGRGR